MQGKRRQTKLFAFQKEEVQMKILGISGGMRNGSNDGMCIEALMGAKEMGAEVEFI